jgi:predicted HTH transcriptional regulator
MIQKELSKIEDKDLQSLIDNSVIEKKTLDYKKTIQGNTDSEKKEFLADLSSFANASGGDLIFGVSQDNATGIPKELVGLEIGNVDREIQRLLNIIRDGIEPRIPSVDIHPVPLSKTKTALVIRVQKSWISPHRVAFKGDHRFYIRN